MADCKENKKVMYCDMDKFAEAICKDMRLTEDEANKFIQVLWEQPQAVEIKQGEALLPLTVKELSHLINDLISYIWKLEDKGLDKAEFGYFSRKELLEKLKQFEKDNFQPLAESPCCDAKMDGKGAENE